jgi:hypothetical protein
MCIPPKQPERRTSTLMCAWRRFFGDRNETEPKDKPGLGALHGSHSELSRDFAFAVQNAFRIVSRLYPDRGFASYPKDLGSNLMGGTLPTRQDFRTRGHVLQVECKG